MRFLMKNKEKGDIYANMPFKRKSVHKYFITVIRLLISPCIALQFFCYNWFDIQNICDEACQMQALVTIWHLPQIHI